ncbi:MAG: hypothetical protein K8S15_10135 [Candidatus Aegiribacteria sp.]|nr:hypothetical protein [Candidatus Aegiribacteria sp.]
MVDTVSKPRQTNPDNPPYASHFSIPCFLDISSIDLAEDEGPDIELDGVGEDASLNPTDLPRL